MKGIHFISRDRGKMRGRRGKETKTGTVWNIIILLLINDKWELHESP